MKRDLLQSNAVHAGFRSREPREDVDRALANRAGERRAREPGADVAKSGVLALELSADHREARSGERMVAMGIDLDANRLAEAGGADRGDEIDPMFGPRVEDRRDEHVAGDPAERIEVDMHGFEAATSA